MAQHSSFYRWLHGLSFCYLWFFSIFYGFVMLYIPLIPMIFVSNRIYRIATDKIFAFWELFPTGLLQLMSGTQIYVHGDQVDPEETSLIVANHRTRVDWNYLWMCMFHAVKRNNLQYCEQYGNGNYSHRNGNANRSNSLCSKMDQVVFGLQKLWEIFNQKLRMKFVLKDEIRHIPGPGWVMQCNCFMYIKRQWESDKSTISLVEDYFNDIDYDHQLLIFPEGTNMSPKTLEKSDSFARKNNLEHYKYVLHPRTRGFTSLCQSMSPRLSAVYDITMAYINPKIIAGEECGLKDILRGDFPQAVHFFIKRYPIESLPKDDEGLAQWLNDRWKAKEEQLKNFYRHGRFLDASNSLRNQNTKVSLTVALTFWISLVVFCPILLHFSQYYRWYCILYCIIFVVLSICFDGFNRMEISLFYMKQRLLQFLGNLSHENTD